MQARFPEDSRFRNMPVRLNGMIAVPDDQGGPPVSAQRRDGGPYPLVVVLHGNHPGCPLDETNADRWPCDPQVEQPNYRGFEYLIRQLAARGYVALSSNINAENTFGFGEPTPGAHSGETDRMYTKTGNAYSAPRFFWVFLINRSKPVVPASQCRNY